MYGRLTAHRAFVLSFARPRAALLGRAIANRSRGSPRGYWYRIQKSRSEPSIHEKWELFFQDPKQWWDNRSSKKKGSVSHDFLHRTKYYKLQITKALLPDLLPRLEAIDQGEEEKKPLVQPSPESAWADLFEHPWYYKDVRFSKFTPRSPDFRHKTTNLGLWLDSAPDWVWESLRALDEAFISGKPAMMIKTGSMDRGEPAELPVLAEDAKPPLEWTTEQQQQGVDVLMSSLDHDLSDEASPPEDAFSGTLMQHQRQGLAWMLKREADPERPFGMLCDEQGLGKTAQAMALIAINPCPPLACEEEEDSMDTTNELAVALEVRRESNGLACTSGRAENDKADRAAALQDSLHIKATLVIVPKSLIRQWQHDLEAWTRLKVLLYADSQRDRITDPSILGDYDVVLASYNTVLYDSPVMLSEPRALFRVRWWRILLDEAQEIKASRGKRVAAAVLLEVVPGGKRWLMTGTPLQNSPEELYSYFHFLRYAPFDSRAAFQKLFSRRAGDLHATVAVLRSIVRPIMLRRTKRSRIDGALVMPLPPRRIASEGLNFSANENAMYRDIEREYCGACREVEDSLERHHIVLKQIMQLRRLCDHPWLAKEYIERLRFSGDGDETGKQLQQVLGCTGDLPPSAKLQAVMELIEEHAGTEKMMVFSQWTDMLDLIEHSIGEGDWKYVRLDGSMDLREREAAVGRFKTDEATRIFLISLSAGKEGLNLAEATRIVLVEPHFNPMHQEQAIDRAHRYGQTKSVHAHKLFIRGTIEERILELQQYKMQISAAIIQETGAKLPSRRGVLGSRFTLKDCQYLLGAAELPEEYAWERDEDEMAIRPPILSQVVGSQALGTPDAALVHE